MIGGYCVSNQKTVDTKYYTKRQKVVRDLIHEYVYLTAFEISLIDTPYFQRLRDIKQVNASFVFQNANHTRFEHSLGTFELTRRAIEAVKDNGLFVDEVVSSVIHPSIEFSTLIAALMHDVGHSPFSHLGEKQFDKQALCNRLEEKLKGINIDENTARLLSKSGAPHEKLSCLVVIEKLWEKMKKARYRSNDNIGDIEVHLDIEHICRCILGVAYNSLNELPEYISRRKTSLCEEDLCICNFCIRLVNWSVFDMDSLDYIMRDNMYCGLSDGKIDTQRLFSNMFISKSGTPIFKRNAISVLKDIIDEKNNDYLYSVNHHATIYSNFLYTFLFRRFKNDNLYDMNKFFSANAVINNLVSDSDLFCMLKKRRREFESQIRDENFSSPREKYFINRANDLLTSLFSRKFLKPLWKDILEFESFRTRHFTNKDATFDRICARVCLGASENFRSEAVQCIVFIANNLNVYKPTMMPQRLEMHELFLIEVQQKWLDSTNIRELFIYLRDNEVRNPTRFGGESPYKYKEKSLEDVLPLSPYSKHYSIRGFYIYVKPIRASNIEVEEKYYTNLEKIIVTVLSYYADDDTGEVDRLLSMPTEAPDRKPLTDEIYEEVWKLVKTEFGID